jgi:hypothetical protein
MAFHVARIERSETRAHHDREKEEAARAVKDCRQAMATGAMKSNARHQP